MNEHLPRLSGAVLPRRFFVLLLSCVSISAMTLAVDIGNAASIEAAAENYPDGVGVSDPYANAVVDYQVFGSKNTHIDPNTVLATPCAQDGGDLSLGGGWIIVDMGQGEAIVDGPGADLRVYESETDPLCNGGSASPYETYVADASSGPWISIGRGEGVSEFDLVASGLTLVRYIKVQDRSNGQPDNSSATPGADIAGFEALNLQQPPFTGHLTSPVSGITIGQSTLLVKAEVASNSSESVKQVEFHAYYNASWHSAGIDTTEAFEVGWEMPNKLRSQQILFGMNVEGAAGTRIEQLGGTVTVNYIESLGNPDLNENWIPARLYLNQRSLSPNGDSKCSAASLAMILAMNGLISPDYETMSAAANNIYPDVLNNEGIAYVWRMTDALKQRGMDASHSGENGAEVDVAWTTLVGEIDSGRPIVVRTTGMTSFGHYIVAVGYREAVGSRHIIVYDPFGRWTGTVDSYDLNDITAASRKGQWVYYDFDLVFGARNWLITAKPSAATAADLTGDTPSSDPDLLSSEPINIGTYTGIEDRTTETLFLPMIVR